MKYYNKTTGPPELKYDALEWDVEETIHLNTYYYYTYYNGNSKM
jgi:hypothetical protein